MGTDRKCRWTEADVKCPFYVSDSRERASICCEGFTEEARLTSSFKSIRARERHMGVYCVENYERCPLYRLTYGSKYAE